MISTVSSGPIREILAAQNPVARISPTNRACSSVTPLRDPVQSLIRAGHPDVLRLAAVDAAAPEPIRRLDLCSY